MASLFGGQTNSVRLWLYEEGTDRLILEVELNVRQLPAALDNETTMNLGGYDWVIVAAEPPTIREAEAEGRLKLTVRRADLEPGLIRFPLPTTESHHPVVDPNSSKAGKTVLQIHADLWRQVEFVSRSFSADIEAEFTAIRNVIETQSHETGGFVGQHSRAAIDPPIVAPSFTLASFRDFLEGEYDDLEGIVLTGSDQLVRGGFAFKTDRLTDYYGIEQGGIVFVLALAGPGAHEYDSPEVQALAEFAVEHELLLVDWCATTIFDPADEAFFQYFDEPVSDEPLEGAV